MVSSCMKFLTLAALLVFLGGGCFAADNFFGVGEDAEVTISPELENSIRRGLAFLASKQSPDGSWSGNYGKNVGEASLAILAFMSMGNFPGEGEYSQVVARGLDWVIAQSQANGLIQYTGQSRQAPVMYGHALATLMLSEMWGQTRRQDVREVLAKAVDLIVRVQGPRGGWNYRSVPVDGDTSVCVMQIIALKSAQEAGIFVPEETISKAVELIRTRFDANNAGYGYNNSKFNPHHAGSSAAGATIMVICGVKEQELTLAPTRNHIGIASKVSSQHGYFSYYLAVGSYALGEKTFRECMQAIEPEMLKRQRNDGGWNEVWNSSFYVLAAAMPYRYLPIYQR